MIAYFFIGMAFVTGFAIYLLPNPKGTSATDQRIFVRVVQGHWLLAFALAGVLHYDLRWDSTYVGYGHDLALVARALSFGVVL